MKKSQFVFFSLLTRFCASVKPNFAENITRTMFFVTINELIKSLIFEECIWQCLKSNDPGGGHELRNTLRNVFSISGSADGTQSDGVRPHQHREENHKIVDKTNSEEII